MTRKVGWRTEKPSIDELRGVMKTLMKTAMITTMKVLHGTVITILNYDYYQTVGNYEFAYESRNDSRNDSRNINKNGFNNKKDSCPLEKKAKVDYCPCKQILDLYHFLLAELPKVRKFTEERKKMLSARWYEKARSEGGLHSNTLEFWEAFFKYITRSDFLMGRKTDFRANFEWIITKRNFNKIIEGNYHRV